MVQADVVGGVGGTPWIPQWKAAARALRALHKLYPEVWYFHRILDHNQKVGMPFLSAETTFLLKGILYWFTMVVLAAYLGNIVHRVATGQKVSLPKIAVMATTVFIIWYGWIHINDLVIGYAAFAVFHDIQYFAIVWVYNNNLVKRQERSTKVLRAFFTTRTLPILVAYILVCFAYGSINMLEGFLKSEQAIKTVEIFVITSTLLHYYFDGFIWKMRDKKNQANLGISAEDGVERIGSGMLQSGWGYTREAGRQMAYFAVPVLCLSLFQFYWTADEAEANGATFSNTVSPPSPSPTTSGSPSPSTSATSAT